MTKTGYLRRSSALKSSRLSSMPVDKSNVHSLYIELASLQMACSRHEKIIEALHTQLRRAEEAIQQSKAEMDRIQEQIQAVEAPRRRSAKPGSTPSNEGEKSDSGFVFDY